MSIESAELPLGDSFNAQFDQFASWRRDFSQRLRRLVEWLKAHELMDHAVEERLAMLDSRLRSDKVMVAFVAEFSRGKSELINAIFFAEYGRRIMPASAGRTTMCPTELGYDADVPPCLRLLPVETRSQPQSLMEWRMVPEQWTRVDLDVNDPAQLATVFEMVSEVRRVPLDEARALGFWNSEDPENNPSVAADGSVEIPRWRHALINIAHPLLKQGLVILDTPGLNAIGAEPELTVSLIPQAHAVVFILGADTGVTRSDLTIWREHLSEEGGRSESRLVVLNKIDGLWDELSTPEQVALQIHKQQVTTAEILGLPQDRVLPVSAQKGLVAKVTNDSDLLRRSRLPELENRLSHGLLAQRQSVLVAAVNAGLTQLHGQAVHLLHIRRRELEEQMQELQGLRGKNTNVIRHMRGRIDQEKAEFDACGARIHAVRTVHMKLLHDVFDILGSPSLKVEMGVLTHTLRTPGIKLGVRKAYADTFERLRANLQKAVQATQEIQSMLAGVFKQLNADFGFSLQPPRELDLSRFERDLALVERNHVQYLGVGNTLKLAQPEFADRLVRALTTRLRMVFESAQGEVEIWSKTAASQLDMQLRERRRNFGRRVEAIERIEQAAGGLDDRIAEISAQGEQLQRLEDELRQMTGALMGLNEEDRSGFSSTLPHELAAA